MLSLKKVGTYYSYSLLTETFLSDEFLGPTTPRMPVTGCPENISVASHPNGTCTSVEWEEPMNNSEVIVLHNQTHFSGDIFCFNQPAQVTYSFYDFVYEEFFECSFRVVVLGTVTSGGLWAAILTIFSLTIILQSL